MTRNWRVLLLSGAVIVLALSGLVSTVVGLGRVRGEPGALFWLLLLFDVTVFCALVWAGFVLPSRRASLRQRTSIVLGLGVLQQLLGLAFSLRHPAAWFPSLIYLGVFGLALAHQLRPLPPEEPRHHVGPDDLHREHPVVAPKIADGPGWHEALLASLRETGMPDTPRPRRWPFILGLFGVLVGARLIDFVIDQLLKGAPPQVAADVWLVAALVLLPLVGIPAARLRRGVQQSRARRAEQSLQKAGAKRPVFYLRSFRLDQAIGQPTVLELISNVNSANPEQQLTQVLTKTGPVIAIGRPGEALPSLGAARFYVSDALWQEKVADVATVAQLVVWASGTTLGLQWEITHLIASLPPEKLILWAHPHLLDLDPEEREVEWSRFVDGLGTLFPKPLPKPLGETRFFAFGPDFTPIAFAGHGPGQARRQSSALRDLLIYKQTPPFDPPAVARRRRVRRIVGGGLGAVVGLLLLVVLVAFVNYARPGAPPPLGWNLLADDLLDDELLPDTSWDPNTSAEVSSPRTPDAVHAKLQDTITALNGHLFGKNWQNMPPGRMGELKKAAQAYDDAYVHGHASTAVATAYEGNGAPIAFTAGPNADNSAARAALVDLLAAVKAAHQPWIDNLAATKGFFYADRIRAVFEAREALLNSEIALIDFFGQHHDWTETLNDQGQTVIPQSGDQVFDDQMPVLLRARAQAAATLKKAEADATTL